MSLWHWDGRKTPYHRELEDEELCARHPDLQYHLYRHYWKRDGYHHGVHHDRFVRSCSLKSPTGDVWHHADIEKVTCPECLGREAVYAVHEE